MRLFALVFALSLIACKSKDAADPQTWIPKLEDRDPKVRVQAVQQLRKLKAKQAAPRIAALLKDPLVKEEAALALEDLGGPEQVDALLDAVDTTVGAGSDTAARAANRTNARIAEALGNIGDALGRPCSGSPGPETTTSGSRPWKRSETSSRGTRFPSSRTSSMTPQRRRS